MIGRVVEYINQFEDWTVYSERLQQYFCANKIEEAKVKVATLISVIGITLKSINLLQFNILYFTI